MLFARKYCRTRQWGSVEWLPAFTMSPFSHLCFQGSIQADSTTGRWRGLDKIIFSLCQPELQPDNGKLPECRVSQLHWKVLHRERVLLLFMYSFLSLTDRRLVSVLERENIGTRGTRDFIHPCLPLPSGCHYDFLLVHKGHGFHLCAFLEFTVVHVLLTLQDMAGIPSLWTVFSSHQSSEACENIWPFTLRRQWEFKEHLLLYQQGQILSRIKARQGRLISVQNVQSGVGGKTWSLGGPHWWRQDPEVMVPHSLAAEETDRTGPKEAPGCNSQDPLQMTHVSQLVLTSQRPYKLPKQRFQPGPIIWASGRHFRLKPHLPLNPCGPEQTSPFWPLDPQHGKSTRYKRFNWNLRFMYSNVQKFETPLGTSCSRQHYIERSMRCIDSTWYGMRGLGEVQNIRPWRRAEWRFLNTSAQWGFPSCDCQDGSYQNDPFT